MASPRAAKPSSLGCPMCLIFFRSTYTLTAPLMPLPQPGTTPDATETSSKPQAVAGPDALKQRAQAQAILSELHRLIGQCGPRHWKIHATIARDSLTVRLVEYHTPKHLLMWLFYLPSLLVEGKCRLAFAMRLSSIRTPQSFMDAALRKASGAEEKGKPKDPG